MEETIKIGGKFKDGYMGGVAWTGTNYHGYMRYSDINKIVKKAFKAKYPNDKVSCTGKSFSGGQECNGTLFIHNCDIYTLEEFMKNAKEKGYYPNAYWYYVDGECIFHENPKLTYEIKLECVYKSYVKNLKGYSGCIARNIDDFDKLVLKPDVIEKLSYLKGLYDSFNDYDVNGMVDYFDVMFYESIYVELVD